MSRWLATILVVLAFPSAAYADDIDPRTEVCNGKPLGSACETPLGEKGTCGQTTCSKLDYSQGTPPKSKQYPCMRCLPAPATSQAASAPSAAKPAAAAPSATPATNTPPAAPTKQGACSASSAGGHAASAVPLVAALALGATLRARRHAKR